MGGWTSPSCGDRTYTRRLTLKDDKTFTALDLVAPCPPKVQCIWAGIVAWSGTWALDDKGALLTKTSGGRDPTKKSNTDGPLRLVLDKATSTSTPAEVDASGKTCAYTRMSEGEGSSKP